MKESIKLITIDHRGKPTHWRFVSTPAINEAKAGGGSGRERAPENVDQSLLSVILVDTHGLRP
jgi:hypothetical protein